MTDSEIIIAVAKLDGWHFPVDETPTEHTWI